MNSTQTHSARKIFITGATGFLGRHLTAELLKRGHLVRAIVRKGSERNVASGCEMIVGYALEDSYAEHVKSAGTLVHLFGELHPSPWKVKEFRDIDLASAKVAHTAALKAKVEHFVYVSAVQPAPLM
jgi:nucleoside-diphosphate-sugar epimerase